MRDADVRTAVKCYLEHIHRGEDSTRIVEEMGVWSGAVRIDIAVINGELCGYELKSDRDTLQRLPMQSEIYSRVFDSMTLVTGPRHGDKAMAIIPDWWGIMRATETDGGLALETIRSGRANPNPEPYLVAELLRKEEALEILEIFGLAKGWRGKRIKAIHQRLASELPFSTLAYQVRSVLKNRKDWLGQNVTDQIAVPVNAELDPMF